MEVLRDRLAGKSKRIIGYGHIGDSNLHLSVASDADSPELRELIEPFVFEWTGEGVLVHT